MLLESALFGSLGLAVLRVVVGLTFVSHAVPKIEDPESTKEFFNRVGLPDSMYLVYLAIGIEIVAGTMLGVGLFTRLSALVLTFFMLIATYVAIVKMDKDFREGFEVDMLLLASSFMFYLNGPGLYSLDMVLG